MVTAGKCKDCVLEVIKVDLQREEVRRAMKDYGIAAVPTIVVDGVIKVVGRPTFPWFCGDEFYKFLKERFPLLRPLGRRDT